MGNWNSLWKISAPARVKHLLWRICKDCLPTRVRLRQHHVPCAPNCPSCDNGYEDDWHVFFGCLEVISSWRAASLYDVIFHRLHSFQDAKSVIFYICCKEDSNLAGRVAVMLEGLWKNRNDWVWNNEKEEATKLGWLALHKWQDWFSAQHIRHSEGNEENLLQWQPPSSGSFKCNVDAGFNRQLGTTNCGWCLRDDHGDFVIAGTAWDGGTLSIIEAEALALKEAIHGISTLHFGHVLFESDFQMVVQGLRSTASGHSEFNCIISSIKLLLLDLPHFEVKSTPKRHMLYTFLVQYLLDSHNVRQDIYDMLEVEGRKIFDSSAIKLMKYKDNEE
ncbi:uncharacterized protein LOC131658061 [Vicia villosa]|uniref:uncharacterized protein LOC131658061 n=1 Tax=Vicia villosa TaxID=3911 RepID=UPI00273B9B92|nr:uncharacterized protein LOC131658061 [Vicia villosa]